MTWEEYLSPDVVAEFEKETQIDVDFVFFSNVEELKARLQSDPDACDLVIADGGTMGSLIELQILQPIEKEKISNFGNLDGKYLNQRFDPMNRFSVPYMWGTTLIAYRNDLIPEPKKSWDALWDERYAGKVSMLDEKTDSYSAALLHLGLDMNSEKPEDLKAATEALVAQVAKLESRFLDFKSVEAGLVSGDCWICMIYSSDAARMAEEHENVSFFVPEEGAPIWLDSFALSRESRNLQNAHKFVNFLARAEVAAANANFLWGATANRAALPLINADLAGNEALYPGGDLLARCQFLTQKGSDYERITNKGMKLVYDTRQTGKEGGRHVRREVEQGHQAESHVNADASND